MCVRVLAQLYPLQNSSQWRPKVPPAERGCNLLKAERERDKRGREMGSGGGGSVCNELGMCPVSEL